MDIETILTELRVEHDQLTDVIHCFERLVATTAPKRRGRPPAWMAEIKRNRPPDRPLVEQKHRRKQKTVRPRLGTLG